MIVHFSMSYMLIDTHNHPQVGTMVFFTPFPLIDNGDHTTM